jgi:hypothetical protein
VASMRMHANGKWGKTTHCDYWGYACLMRVSYILNRVSHKQNCWLDRVIKWRSFITWEKSFPHWPVSVRVSPGCYAHLLERYVSKIALFAWNEEEREGSSFTMVKPHGLCFPCGEMRWNSHWGLNRFTILHVI